MRGFEGCHRGLAHAALRVAGARVRGGSHELDLYRTGDDPPSTAWGILETAPVLVKLRASSAGGWAIERKWDFSAYMHSDIGFASENPAWTFVYPALYPVGPGTWAVALVASASQRFAGGGASYQVADFVVLGEGDPTVTAYSNLPFSCGKGLQGCGTEEEYRRSPNCSDFYEGFLTIAYRPSKSRERYVWTLTWHERHQPPGVPKAQTQVTQSTVDLPIDKVDVSNATFSVPFCGRGIGDDNDAPAPAP